ncbi:MAG: DNA primase [Candidatus Gottesmanbacteria bacterium]
MADQLEEIKSKIDIIGFINEYLPLKKAGRNFKALCPFHSEKTPSFVVSAERQIWHCFGCQKGGDIFGFLMQIENLEFPEALEILAKRAGIRLISSYQMSDISKRKDKIYKINHLASEFFHYLLLNHPSGKAALNYVLGRGVNKKAIDTFSLGWAPNQWDALEKFLLKKSFTRTEIESAGLIIRSTDHYYDRFRGRLMFTLKDQRGNIIGFAGRVLDPDIKEAHSTSSGQAKYINTPETLVYIKGNTLYGLDITKDAIKKENQAIIVEGEFDLISSFQAGVANVVAIKGSALTEGHVNLLKRFTENISLALDMDLAGDAAVRRGIEIADNAGLSIKVVKLPQGKDPDECARINSGLWQKAVKSAIPIYDYLIESAMSRFDYQTADGKKKIGDEVIPVITKITNPIVQAHYINKLAKLLSVSEEIISETAKRFTKKQTFSPPTVNIVQSTVSRLELLEEHLLAYTLQSKEPKTVVEVNEINKVIDYLINPALIKCFKLLISYLELNNKEFIISDFVKTLPAELVPIVDRAYLIDLGEIINHQDLYDKELVKTIAEIKKITLKSRLSNLTSHLKESNKQDLDHLSQEYHQYADELKKISIK